MTEPRCTEQLPAGHGITIYGERVAHPEIRCERRAEHTLPHVATIADERGAAKLQWPV